MSTRRALFKSKTSSKIDRGNDLPASKDNTLDEGRRVGQRRDMFDHLHLLNTSAADAVGGSCDFEKYVGFCVCVRLIHDGVSTLFGFRLLHSSE